MFKARAIIFDLDGTLIDSAEGIVNSIRYALEALGLSTPARDVLERYIGPPLQASFHELLGVRRADKVNAAVGHYRHRYIAEGKGVIENKIYPDIHGLLDRLKNASKNMYIATSKPIGISRKITAHFDLDRYFTGIYGSELDGTRSDKGELLAYLLAQEDIKAQDAVMIGDRKHDIIGAKKNDMRGIGVCWGYGSISELKAAGAIDLASSPLGLASMLLGGGSP